jgi:hypothetical protein
MAYAVALGVFGALAALVFLGIIGHGAKWFSDANSGWLGGHWLWLAITVAAGVVVGVLHRVMHLPELTPGFVADLPDEHVDTKQVPGIAVVSAVSLIGGASLGPEKALGAIGGGAGSWLAARRKLDKGDSQVNTLAGFAGSMIWMKGLPDPPPEAPHGYGNAATEGNQLADQSVWGVPDRLIHVRSFWYLSAYFRERRTLLKSPAVPLTAPSKVADRYGASVGSVEQKAPAARCSGPDLSGVATFDAHLDAAIEGAMAEENLSRAIVQIRSNCRVS